MKIVSIKTVLIKRLVLSLILGLGSVMTLPAYAWPDTDEMNMCGAAIKTVRGYNGDHRSWASHDNYVAQRGNAYYQRTNCPQSKATKNYKGKNWAPGAKMRVKHRMHKKHGYKHHKHHAKHHAKYHAKKHAHNPNHKNHADCIRTDRMNNGGAIVKKVAYRPHQNAYKSMQKVDHKFYRQAQAVLNMSRVKHVSRIHNPKHKNHADCVRTDGLNHGGAVVRVVNRKHH